MTSVTQAITKTVSRACVVLCLLLCGLKSQSEAESGQLSGSASVVQISSASGGAAVLLEGGGAAQYEPIAPSAGAYRVVLRYRSSGDGKLKLRLLPGGGSVMAVLSSTGGEWRRAAFGGFTVGSNPVYFAMHHAEGARLELDCYAIEPVICVGCELVIYDNSLPPLTDPLLPTLPAPPIMRIDNPPTPGFEPAPVSELLAPKEPFVPTSPTATNSGYLMGEKWVWTVSYPPGLTKVSGPAIEFSNMTWDAIEAGACDPAGCVPTEDLCKLGVSMSAKLLLSPLMNKNYTTFHDSQGSHIAVENGAAVVLASSASGFCGEGEKKSVVISWDYFSEANVGAHRVRMPLVDLAFECWSCRVVPVEPEEH